MAGMAWKSSCGRVTVEADMLKGEKCVCVWVGGWKCTVAIDGNVLVRRKVKSLQAVKAAT